MSLLERLFGNRQQQPEDYSLVRTLSPNQVGKPTWPTWDPAQSYNDGMRKLALVYRCLTMVAHSAGAAPVRVYSENAPDQDLKGHPLRDLMMKPNPEMGGARFIGQIALRAANSGFCVVEKERDQLGRIIGLWPLNSAWLKAKPQQNAPCNWDYTIPGIPKPFKLEAKNVLHFTWADTPNGSPYGMGPVEAAFREIGLSNEMTDFIKRFFETGAVPLLGLIPDLMPGTTLSQRQADRILSGFLDRHAGLQSSAIPMIMAGVKDIKRLGFDFNELALTDLRDLTELAIVQAFGIPPSVAQIRVGLEHSESRANAQIDEGRFYRSTMIPLWSRIDDTLTVGLLTEYEDPDSPLSLEFDLSKVKELQEDRNLKADWVVKGFQAGLLSAHLAHEELGLKKPKGDDYYMRSMAVELFPADDPLGLDMPEPTITPLPNPAPLALPSGTEPDDDDEAADKNALQALRESLSRPGPYRSRREQYAAKAATSRKLIGTVAKNRTPSLASFFKAQGARLIPIITNQAQQLSATPSEEVYTVEEVDWQAEYVKLQDVVKTVHVLGTKTGFQATPSIWGLETGLDFDLSNPTVKDVVDKLGHRIVGINEESRKEIAEVVSKALASGTTVADRKGEDGKTIPGIASLLKAKFAEFSTVRATRIARTESTIAYAHGSVLGFEATGLVDRAEIFDNPEHTDPYGASDGLTCATRDGIIVWLAKATFHAEADHPNGSVVITPMLTGDEPAGVTFDFAG